MRPLDESAPQRAITGYERDDEGHWVARLACGHTQHLRHEPPWQVREWVLTEEGRAARLGTTLPCMKCVREVGPE